MADAPDGSPTIYCVHGGGGDLEELRPLAEALKGKTRFYGLNSRGLDGVRAPFESYEEEAACILDHICAQDPGPYILAGFSGGGAIAYEVAQQMLRLGRKVELIMMFDSLEPSAWAAPLTRKDRLGLLPQADLRFLVKIASEKLGYSQPIAGLIAPHTVKAGVYAAFLRSQARYISKPYAGEIFLVRALSGGWLHLRAGKTLGWEKVVTGPIEICKFNCDHHELIMPPKVFELARAVLERLKRLAHQKSSLNS
jgi:thioesterase domain-containing protein